MFPGCVQDAWFRPVNQASVDALVERGYCVDVPDVTCCGALAAHYGRLALAKELARRNVAALSSTEGPIVIASAGCGAALKEYGHLLDDDPAAVAVAGRVRDITEILAAEPPSPTGLGPLDVAMTTRNGPNPGGARVAVHDPCHLVHAQKVAVQPRAAMRAAGLDLVDIPDSTVCCGAAGLYNILQPEAAAELGRRKAEAILSVDPGVVAVANPGCAMQIALHLREAGRGDIKVAHPVELV
jgi:glycolate oxidase iron-sulfur subunit